MSPQTRQALDEAFASIRQRDLPISERIASYVDVVRRLWPDQAAAVDRLVARLTAAGAGADAPQVGDTLPDFMMPDDAGRLVTLDEALQAGPAAITFFRGHWCPYCRIGGFALARASVRIAEVGGQVIGISPETAVYASQFKVDAGARFQMLCDLDNAYAMSLSLVVPLGEEMRTRLTARGRDVSVYQQNDAWLLPIPATFVVARDKTIAARFVDPNMRHRMEVDDIVAAFRSL